MLKATEGVGVREPLPRTDVAVLDWILPGVSSADGGRCRAAAHRCLQRLPDRPAEWGPVLKPAVQVKDAQLFKLPSHRVAH